MQTLLFKLGLVLFVIGLLTGFAIPALKNPRMGLTSHLEGVLNGMFLALLGLLWPHVDLPHAWGITAVVLIVYSAFANWLGTLLAAAWGAGRNWRRSLRETTKHRRSKRSSSVFWWCHCRWRS